MSETRSAHLLAESARVKAAASLSSIIGQNVDLRKEGRVLVGCCPFHNEKTPSFKVYADHYHCFGCGEHGDVFDWLEKRQGLSFRDAITHLGGVVDDPKPEEAAASWVPILPAPPTAPRPNFGRYDHVYPYANAEGSPLFYVRRRNATDAAKKLFTPLTYGTLDGRLGWHPKHPLAPRPLYGLDRLAFRPSAAVVICEGEKAADAAQKMLPDLACICWCAGTANIDKADWAPLTDRSPIYIWPDNDAAGHKAAAWLKDHLHARFPAAKIHTLRVTDLPAKADAADIEVDIAWLEDRTKPEPKKANGHDPHPPPVEDAGRPAITVYNGLRHKAADEGIAALVAAGTPFYQRDRNLVRAALIKAKAADGRIVEVPGILPVTNALLARALGSAAEWQRPKKDGDLIRIDPPGEVVEQIGAMVGDWPFPPLAGVIATPTLRPDGSLLITEGYDDATGLVLLGPPKMPPLLETPRWADAQRSMDLIIGLLEEFPFSDEASKSVALSMILTVVARGALLPAVPLHVVTAPQAGTGKSYLLDTAAAIATGERCPVFAYADKQEETEKRLVAAALAGLPIIALDNVNDILTGDFLAQVTERPILMVRPLGSSFVVRLANTFTVFANGNNIIATADLVRRTLRCGLDADMENPEERQYTNDPVGTVLADRGKYVHACLTVLRAFWAAGRPQTTTRLPSFPAWSDTIRNAICWLGWPDPVESMDVARGDDPSRQNRAAVFDAWAKELGVNGEGHQTGEIVKAANGYVLDDPTHPELREALLAISRERNSNAVSPERLGKWLRAAKDSRVGVLKLTVDRTDKKRPRWVMIKGGSL